MSLAFGGVQNYADKLHVKEHLVVERAVEKRVREFSTGRMLARAAIQELGPRDEDFTILRGEERNPLWPAELTGSISHTDRHAIAVVARSSYISGIGIDLEVMNRVSEKLTRFLLTEGEKTRLNASANPPRELTLLFSAKEAVFKAVNPLIGQMIDYRECEIEFDRVAATFNATYRGDHLENALMNTGKGCFVEFEGNIITGYLLH